MTKRLAIISVALLLLFAVGGSVGWLWWNDFDSNRAFQFADRNAHTTDLKTYNGEEHAAAFMRSESARRHLKDLNAAQDRATQGDREALTEQKRLLTEMARDISHWPDDDLGRTPNVVVMLAYVLCGGNAAVIGAQLERAASRHESKEIKDLIGGVRAYGARRRKDALAEFLTVDWQLVDQSLVGPLALAKASLLIKDDPKEAVLLLDRARLNAPSTAIDEAATRWEVPLLMGDDDLDRGLQLTSQYLRKFSDSIYAEGFLDIFSAAVAGSKAAAAPEQFQKFTTTIDTVDDRLRADLFLGVSKRALMKGNISLAKVAADAVDILNSKSAVQKLQAELYAAAADAPTENASAAVKILNGIDGSRLDAADKAILDTARAIAGSVVGAQAGIGRNDFNGPARVALTGEASATPEKGEGVDRTIARVQQVLTDTDRLIAGE